MAIPSNGILISQGSRNVVRGNEVTLVGDEDETIDAGIRIRREDGDDDEEGGLGTDNLVTRNLVNDNLADGILITEGRRPTTSSTTPCCATAVRCRGRSSSMPQEGALPEDRPVASRSTSGIGTTAA